MNWFAPQDDAIAMMRWGFTWGFIAFAVSVSFLLPENKDGT